MLRPLPTSRRLRRCSTLTQTRSIRPRLDEIPITSMNVLAMSTTFETTVITIQDAAAVAVKTNLGSILSNAASRWQKQSLRMSGLRSRRNEKHPQVSCSSLLAITLLKTSAADPAEAENAGTPAADLTARDADSAMPTSSSATCSRNIKQAALPDVRSMLDAALKSLQVRSKARDAFITVSRDFKPHYVS